MEESRAQSLAVVSHLGGLVPIPWVPILIPLFIWILKGGYSSFVEQQSKEAMNFQISISIYWLVVTVLLFFVAPLIYIIFIVMNVFCSIKGAVRTSNGKTYKYPLNLRLIK
jgi:uncharacterized protein